jgi:hypothetical protein
MSYGSAWVIIWVLTRALIAFMSVLRETAFVFAVVIGVVILKERLSLLRLASIATTLIGTAVPGHGPAGIGEQAAHRHVVPSG